MLPITELQQIKGKTIGVRVDLNVPVKDGKIGDIEKLWSIKHTILYLTKRGAKVVLISHFGRPKGKKVAALSLKFVLQELRLATGKQVEFCSSLAPTSVKRFVHKQPDGSVTLLENIRFLKAEEKPTKKATKEFGALFDAYVVEAYGASHRKAMSMTEITSVIPSYLGFQIMKEFAVFDMVRRKRGGLVVLGGAKLETKIPLVQALYKKKHIYVGGALFIDYLVSKGYHVGASKKGKTFTKQMKRIFRSTKVHIPVDLVVVNKKGEYRIVPIGRNKILCEPTEKIVDIGPKTIQLWIKAIEKATLVIWNGPLGLYETHPFHIGSVAIASEIAEVKNRGGVSVVGGGETLDIIDIIKKKRRFSHISTGGGAMISNLAHGTPKQFML